MIVSVKRLSGSAAQVSAASIEDCFALLVMVERYPQWHPETVREVEVLDRDSDGRASRARTTLHVARGPLTKDFHLVMAVTAEAPSTVTLTRLRHEPPDPEEFEVRWRLRPEAGGTQIGLEIEANLSVPRMLPLGGIGEAMASAFVGAAARAVAGPASGSR